MVVVVLVLVGGRGRARQGGLDVIAPDASTSARLAPGVAPPVASGDAASMPGDVNAQRLRGAALTVEVLDAAGRPVPGAMVVVDFVRPTADTFTADHRWQHVDARGRHTFHELASGGYQVDAHFTGPDGGEGRAWMVRMEVTLEPDGAALLTLRDGEDSGLTIRGKTVEARTARVLAGVQVMALRWRADGLYEPGLDWAESDVSDAEGHFALSHLPRGEFALRVDHPEYQRRGPEPVVSAGAAPIVLELERIPKVRGRLVDENGLPVTSFHIDWAPFQTVDGRFELNEFHSGPLSLLFVAEGHAAHEHPYQANGIDDIELGDVQLSPGRAVTVTVVEAGGARPVPGAKVEVGEPVVATATTGADGRARLAHLPAGALPARVRCASLAPWRGLLEETSTEVTVALNAGGRIEGHVRSASGEPRPGVEVTVGERSGITGSDGAYVLAGLSPGEHRVTALVRSANVGFATREVRVADGQTLRLDFQEQAGTTLLLKVSGCNALRVVQGPVSFTRADMARALKSGLEPRRLWPRRLEGLPDGDYTAVCVDDRNPPGQPMRGAILPLILGGAEVQATMPEPAPVPP